MAVRGGDRDMTMSAPVWDLAASGQDLGPQDLALGPDGPPPRPCGWPRRSMSFLSSPITVGTKPAQLSPGDFTGDGILDVAVLLLGDPSTSVPGKVAVLVGDGHGSFTVKGPYAACTNVSSIASGRFSPTGVHRDVVVGCKDSTGSVGTATLLLLKGNGDGTLQAAVAFASQTVEIDSLLAADLDGNGQDDLVISTASNSISMFQTGHALGAQNQISIYSFNHWNVTDVNGDHVLDLVNTFGDNSMGVLRGKAGATPPVTYTEAYYYATNTMLQNTWNVVTDLNNDGSPDVVVSSIDNTTASAPALVLSWDYNQTTKDYPMNPNNVAVTDLVLDEVGAGDFDCDGNQDVVAASVGDNRLTLLRGNGHGLLTPLSGTLTLTSPSDIVSADLNGDHLEDLIIAADTGNAITVLTNVSQ
jgi:hypothetical protein